MPSAASRSSGGSGSLRGRSRGRDNAEITTFDNMTALNNVHPDPLRRMSEVELNKTITAQERLCITKDNEAHQARTVLTAMLIERSSRGDEPHTPTEPGISPSRSNSPPTRVRLIPRSDWPTNRNDATPKRASRSPRTPGRPPIAHAIDHAGSSRDDMQVDRGSGRDAQLTQWRTVPFTIKGGIKIDVPTVQVDARDVNDIRANVLISNWPFNWCEHKMLTMISTLDGQLPVGKPIISAVVFTERRNVGGFGGQIMLRMGNVSLARAVISIFNGRVTYDDLLPLKAVQMHTEVSLVQNRDHPGLVPGQARINEQVWNLADARLTPDAYRGRSRMQEGNHANA